MGQLGVWFSLYEFSTGTKKKILCNTKRMALNYVLNHELFLSNCAYFVERTLGRYYPFFFDCQPAKRINDLKVTLYTITQFTTTQSENLRRKKSSVF